MLYYISDLNKELFITWKRWYSDHKFSQSIDFDSPTVCRDLGGQPSYLEGLWESFSQVASSGRSHTRLLSLAVSLSCKFLISVCFYNTCILSGFMPFALFYFNTDGSFSSWQEKKWEGHLLKWARHGNYTLTNAALCKLRQHDHKLRPTLVLEWVWGLCLKVQLHMGNSESILTLSSVRRWCLWRGCLCF